MRSTSAPSCRRRRSASSRRRSSTTRRRPSSRERRSPESTAVATSLIPDPFQLWREALTKLEGNANSLVTGSMDSQELVRSMHQLSTLSLNMQQAFEKAIGSYLARVNLPSRKDVSELAAALQRVEDKLDRLLPASAA